MKKSIEWSLTCAIVISVLFSCTGGSGTNIAIRDVGNVDGIVLDAQTSQPLAGVQVQIGNTTDTTNASGAYSIGDVDVGTRTITAAMTGYQNYSGTVTVQKGTTVQHNIQLSSYSTGTGSGGGTGGSPPPTRVVTVSLIDEAGDGIPSTTVVLGDVNGKMIEFTVTDSLGQASFSNAPPDATITALYSETVNSTTFNYAFVTYDINLSDVNIPIPFASSADLGTITVAYTNSTGNTITFWCPEVGLSGHTCCMNCTGPYSLSIRKKDLQSDGKISLYALASMNTGSASYGMLLDQDFVSGGTYTIDINQTSFDIVQIAPYNTSGLVNILSSRYYIDSYRKNSGQFVSDGYPTGSTLSVLMMGGFGTIFDYIAEVTADQNGNGDADSIISVNLISSSLGTATIDLGQALPVPTDLAMISAGSNTPTFTWNSNSSDAKAAILHLTTSSPLNIYSLVTSPTRTTLTFPELPAALSAFYPAGLSDFLVTTYDLSCLATYNDFIASRQSRWVRMCPEPFTMRWSQRIYSK